MVKAVMTKKKTLDEYYEDIYKSAGLTKEYKTVIELNSRYIYIRRFPSYCYGKIKCSVLNFINKEDAKKTYNLVIKKIKADYKNVKEETDNVIAVKHLEEFEIDSLFKIKKFKMEKKKNKYLVILKDE